MPDSLTILAQMTTITNDLVALAIAWHLIVPWLWRRATPLVLALPALSVAIVAFAYHNPFNAISFTALAAILATSRPRRRPAPRGWLVVLGAALVAFAALYPHFVAGPAYRILWAAPLGVIPCPTLSLIAGVALATGALGTPRVVAALALWTGVYAMIGIFRLGVVIDLGLVPAAIALAVTAAATPHTPAAWRRLS